MKVLTENLLPCFLLLIFSAQLGASQTRSEVGIGLGVMQYEGDIGGRTGSFPDVMVNKTSPPSFSGTISFTYTPFTFLSFRWQGTIGRIQAADSLLTRSDEIARIKKTRNLHFKSPIRETAVLAELHPFALILPDRISERISPYMLVGAGLFAFKPRALYQSPAGEKEWVDLKPLRTEGQGLPEYPEIAAYRLNAMSFQSGAGIRYSINNQFRIGFEVLWRRSSSDYLDDVSGKFIAHAFLDQFFGAGTSMADKAKQLSNPAAYWNGGNYLPRLEPGAPRGSPKVKDYFYTTMIHLKYHINASDGSKSFHRNSNQSLRCAQF